MFPIWFLPRLRPPSGGLFYGLPLRWNRKPPPAQNWWGLRLLAA
jgi:hypothetical protein